MIVLVFVVMSGPGMLLFLILFYLLSFTIIAALSRGETPTPQLSVPLYFLFSSLFLLTFFTYLSGPQLSVFYVIIRHVLCLLELLLYM